jgi:hypothetical protein
VEQTTRERLERDDRLRYLSLKGKRVHYLFYKPTLLLNIYPAIIILALVEDCSSDGSAKQELRCKQPDELLHGSNLASSRFFLIMISVQIVQIVSIVIWRFWVAASMMAS